MSISYHTRAIVLKISQIRTMLSNAPFGKKKYGGDRASVLIPICGDEARIIMTKKSSKLRIHAGEISFPGGRPEPVDTDMIDTAIREASEEVGLVAERASVLARLDDVRTLGSGYVITPYVCVLDECKKLCPNQEVDKIYDPKLTDLLQTRTEKTIHKVPNSVEFSIDDNVIWGASARILEHLRLLLK